ncbi:MAG: hypothetical protein UT24_C0018G0011 [Candidatus Woesebacteria bacterium GW2011_GWB1_39_12]|uniref:Uncharacterized protein n=1 Tax=Candidatus Woesebacteria bacterium GW2011_GWB1_39_12 TaxID=1618574 RepID=A0A0G0M798_9BACT|nr:MAG: hypothetical protein UT24_C0018G0011 [Candidatus Woesebacteria bacterium GW2011_GWB1_39_12]
MSTKMSQQIFTKQCKNCGSKFQTNSARKIYCKKDCRLLSFNEKRKKARMDQPNNFNKKCPKCLKEFITNSPQQILCNPRCNKEISIKRFCLNCGQDISKMHLLSKYCSKKCKDQYLYSLIKDDIHIELYQKICKNCQKKFNPNSSFQIYCNKKCSNQYRFKTNQGICEICSNNKFVCLNQRYYITICETCRQWVDYGMGPEEIIKIRKHNRKPQNIIFENIYKFAISEISKIYLLSNKIFSSWKFSKHLRYDYYLPNYNILVEINEPCHYNFEDYNIVMMRKGNIKNFLKYQSDFNKKIQMAKENNIPLHIIDIRYKLSKKDLTNIIYQSMINFLKDVDH